MHKFSRHVFFAVAVLAAGAAQAQWTGKAEVGLLYSDGNSEAKSANGKLDMTHEGQTWKQNFYAAVLYGENASFAIRGFSQEARTTASVGVYFADVVAPRGGGSITNFASIAAIKPARHMAAYAAAKSAVAGLTRALALELRDEHIRVNALAPGMVRTATNVKSMGDDPKTRWVELDQIVAAVCYLASDAARAVTGQIIAVTAGDL